MGSWLDTHWERVLDTILLLVALNAPKHLLGLVRTPWLAQLAVLAALILLVSPKAHRSGSTWRRYLRLLPGYAATAAAGLAAFFWWFDLPRFHGWFAPIWLALTLLARLPWVSLRDRLMGWLQVLRGDVLAGDTLLVAWFTCVAPRWSMQGGPGWLAAPLLALWLGANLRAGWHRERTARALLPPIGLATAWGLLWLPAGPSLSAFVFAGWLGLALVGYRLAVGRWAAEPATGTGELLRWLGLAATTGALFHPFARAGIHGSGDAHYYATFLADALAQFRHGVFPVFVGQSEYQFNGSVVPIRIAPAFQYAGGAVDLLTLRLLNPMAVQNLLITATAFAAAFSGYASLRALATPPGRAFAGALLFVTCPGVAGLAFNTDLYMSWLTVPWVPIVLLLGVRTFTHGGLRLYAALGLSLGVLWWMHTPIALWLTAISAALQVVRFVHRRRTGLPLLHEAVAVTAAFLAAAAYPLVSTLLYPADSSVGASGGFVVPANHVLQQLLETFPASWLPLSDLGRRLSDYQLGYGLLIVGIVAARPAWRSGRLGVRAGCVLAAGLILLLVPVPGLNLALWQLVPDAVLVVTNIWVMQRLYLPLAALLVLLLLPALAGPRSGRVLLFACLWSLLEALKFAQGSWATVTPDSASPLRLAPENITLTRYSYGFFPTKPSSFTHGVTDPALETRLLAADLSTEIASNYAAAVRAARNSVAHAFHLVEGHLETTTPVRLEPGRRYLASLRLTGEETLTGSLVLHGRQLQRVYGLPDYGEPRSFGLGGAHNPYFPLHTTVPSGSESVRVLLETPLTPGLAERISFAVLEYPPEALPVRVSAWMPFRAAVQSPTEAWVETPRLYQPGYRARVNGQPAEVRRTPEGLAAVAVPAGASDVELRYAAPAGLQTAFWLSLLALVTETGFLLAMFRRLTATSAAAATPAAPSP